jgi:segregation and condensation protein B
VTENTGLPAGDAAVAEQPEPPLSALLEAILLVVDEPVAVTTLAQVLERPLPVVEEALVGLSADYTEHGRGFDLRQVAGGWRLYTRPECAAWVERFVEDGQPAKLSQAALETLAVIAYQQPVSRARIAAVRGVTVDAVVRTLLARGLIAEAGADPGSGALLYVTTPLFLERLGLSSLTELPAIADAVPDPEDVLEDDATAV